MVMPLEYTTIWQAATQAIGLDGTCDDFGCATYNCFDLPFLVADLGRAGSDMAGTPEDCTAHVWGWLAMGQWRSEG